MVALKLSPREKRVLFSLLGRKAEESPQTWLFFFPFVEHSILLSLVLFSRFKQCPSYSWGSHQDSWKWVLVLLLFSCSRIQILIFDRRTDHHDIHNPTIRSQPWFVCNLAVLFCQPLFTKMKSCDVWWGVGKCVLPLCPSKSTLIPPGLPVRSIQLHTHFSCQCGGCRVLLVRAFRRHTYVTSSSSRSLSLSVACARAVSEVCVCACACMCACLCVRARVHVLLR